MKRVIVLLLCLGIFGCVTYDRLTKIRDEGKNVVVIKVKGGIDKTKDIVREVAKEMGLVERKEAERSDFMTVSCNFLKASTKSLFCGYAGSGSNRLGFFLKYDKESDITEVTIVEEAGLFVAPIRTNFADKIKLKQLESERNLVKINE